MCWQHCPHQAGDRGVVREDPDDAGAAFDLLVEAFLQIGAPHFFQWGCGKWRKARTSSLACSISSGALGKRSASELAKPSQRLAISLASSWANTERSAAVTMPWWSFGTRCSRFRAKGSRQRVRRSPAAAGGLPW
jgi:hypothetical protein